MALAGPSTPLSSFLLSSPAGILALSLMPPKRTRRASPSQSGLSAGERLKRTKLTGNAAYSAWGWVGTEVADTSEITQEHRLATCGLSRSSTQPLCRNKFLDKQKTPCIAVTNDNLGLSEGEGLADEVIVISDDEGPVCNNKACKHNPYCLNYLGQDKWENAGELIYTLSRTNH